MQAKVHRKRAKSVRVNMEAESSEFDDFRRDKKTLF